FLNNKYRKSLGYASALEVATAHDIIKSDSNQKSCIGGQNLPLVKDAYYTYSCQLVKYMFV
ncbi:MAG: hypothetical protein WCT46_06925, partial [Candidatus Gracilibacteria bacterium]